MSEPGEIQELHRWQHEDGTASALAKRDGKLFLLLMGRESEAGVRSGVLLDPLTLDGPHALSMALEMERMLGRLAAAEAELGGARRASGLNFERARSAEAQLAGTHRALEEIRGAAPAVAPRSPIGRNPDDHFVYGRELIRWELGGIALRALSAPALARAAQLNLLRREVCEAAKKEGHRSGPLLAAALMRLCAAEERSDA